MANTLIILVALTLGGCRPNGIIIDDGLPWSDADVLRAIEITNDGRVVDLDMHIKHTSEDPHLTRWCGWTDGYDVMINLHPLCAGPCIADSSLAHEVVHVLEERSGVVGWGAHGLEFEARVGAAESMIRSELCQGGSP